MPEQDNLLVTLATLEDVIAEDLISEKIKADQIVKVGAHQGKLKFTILDELVI